MSVLLSALDTPTAKQQGAQRTFFSLLQDRHSTDMLSLLKKVNLSNQVELSKFRQIGMIRGKIKITVATQFVSHCRPLLCLISILSGRIIPHFVVAD